MKQIETNSIEIDGKVYVTKVYEADKPEFEVGDWVTFVGLTVNVRYAGNEDYFLSNGELRGPYKYLKRHENLEDFNYEAYGLRWNDETKSFDKALGNNSLGEWFWEGDKVLFFCYRSCCISFKIACSNDSLKRTTILSEAYKTRETCEIQLTKYIANKHGYELKKK